MSGKVVLSRAVETVSPSWAFVLATEKAGKAEAPIRSLGASLPTPGLSCTLYVDMLKKKAHGYTLTLHGLSESPSTTYSTTAKPAPTQAMQQDWWVAWGRACKSQYAHTRQHVCTVVELVRTSSWRRALSFSSVKSCSPAGTGHLQFATHCTAATNSEFFELFLSHIDQ